MLSSALVRGVLDSLPDAMVVIDSTAIEAMQHGAFDFLQKPFRGQDLLERIRTHLESLTPREREMLDLKHMAAGGR